MPHDGHGGAVLIANCGRKAHARTISAIEHPCDCGGVRKGDSSLDVGTFFGMMVWSLAYVIVDAVPNGADPVYFAFVNYTTLAMGT